MRRRALQARARASRRARRRPARIFVPPTSTPMTRDCSKAARVPYAAGCAPGGEKPYRVYRGGRAKGRVPTVGRPEKSAPRPKRRARRAQQRTAARAEDDRPAPRQIRWGRELTIALRPDPRLLHRLGGRSATSSFRERRLGGEQAAAAERARAALDADQGGLLSNPTDDPAARHRPRRARGRARGDRHSDSITLLRTDPAHHRLVLPLDPARPARRDPGLRRRRRSTRRSRSAARASRSGRSAPTRRSRSTTSWSSTSPSSRT